MLTSPDYDDLSFDDGRGRYPDTIKAPAPLGLRTKIKHKADEEGISSGELIRRAVFAYLNGDAGHAA
jgi:hypothetical protein